MLVLGKRDWEALVGLTSHLQLFYLALALCVVEVVINAFAWSPPLTVYNCWQKNWSRLEKTLDPFAGLNKDGHVKRVEWFLGELETSRAHDMRQENVEWEKHPDLWLLLNSSRFP